MSAWPRPSFFWYDKDLGHWGSFLHNAAHVVIYKKVKSAQDCLNRLVVFVYTTPFQHIAEEDLTVNAPSLDSFPTRMLYQTYVAIKLDFHRLPITTNLKVTSH